MWNAGLDEKNLTTVSIPMPCAPDRRATRRRGAFEPRPMPIDEDRSPFGLQGQRVGVGRAAELGMADHGPRLEDYAQTRLPEAHAEIGVFVVGRRVANVES